MESSKDSGRARMHLWVSYALALALLGGSVAMMLMAPVPKEPAALGSEVTAAIRYFERNPEVRVNPRLARIIGHDYIAELRDRHEKRKQEGGVAVLTDRMREKTQARFDEAQRRAFESFHELPTWRYAVVDSGSPFRNTFTHLVVNDTWVQLGVSIVAIGIAAVMVEAAWGSLIFGVLCLVLPIVTRVTYTSFFGDQGVPWVGASAFAAGLMGAYLVRSFGGLTVPGWIVFPVWLVAEYVFARDVPLDSFEPTPAVMHGTCFALGAVYAAGVSMLGLEARRFEKRSDTPDLVSNPVVEEALAAHHAGEEERAFELLAAELERAPHNHDAALALWQVASGSSRAESAAPILLGAIRAALRKGRVDDACALWSALVVEVTPRAEATLLVRVAEALLQNEEYDAAVQAYDWAVSAPKPLSSVLAVRVVRGTRDLDGGLAARAAAIALRDDQLALADRKSMEEVAGSASARAGAASAAGPEAPAPEPTPCLADALMEDDEPPQLDSAPTATADSAATPDPAAGLAATRAVGVPPAADPDPYQDPHALAADAFEELPEGASLAAEDPETWNQPGVVGDLTAEASADSSDSSTEEEAGGSFDWSGLQDEDAQTGPDPTVASADLNSADAAGGSGDVSETTETLDEDGVRIDDDSDELAIGDDLADELASGRRVLRTRDAVPLAVRDGAIELDVEGGGKTDLALDRVEAVAAGAVRGLAAKPVLVVDLVLNWVAMPDEPLKVIRIRSDRFDPRAVMPGTGSALDALRALLQAVLEGSGATPLPTREAATGAPFGRYDDAATYAREVLLVG